MANYFGRNTAGPGHRMAVGDKTWIREPPGGYPHRAKGVRVLLPNHYRYHCVAGGNADLLDFPALKNLGS